MKTSSTTTAKYYTSNTSDGMQDSTQQPNSPTSSVEFVPYVPGNKGSMAQKRSKRTIHLSASQLESYFHYPQYEAAKKLGVSLSTLKRRFYELYKGARWPFQGTKKSCNNKQSLHHIINSHNVPTTLIDEETIRALHEAFSCPNLKP